MNGSQEMELYAEIQTELDDIKAGVVESWLDPTAPLAGGYGKSIVAWRGSNSVSLFKDHKHMARSLAESTSIRSNGHAWCTADDNLCVGNDLERTRCTGCRNAVIGTRHLPIYRGLRDHLAEVLQCTDIGQAGMKLVRRDMDRLNGVLNCLEQPVAEASRVRSKDG